MSKDRVQKIISEAGICSRRKAEKLIMQNKVFINGITASIGDKADPAIDSITVNSYLLKKNFLKELSF